MRMHTIPQNVSAYEDRIVGSLIGKQFIYLAIGGVIALVLVTTPFGPTLVRIPLAFVIGLFAVALALFRPNDRPFDQIFFGYMRAILGPTEWAWGKEPSIPPQLDKVLSLGEELKVPAKTTSLRDTQAQKRRQAQHYQRLMTQRRQSGLDESDFQFIDQLDFSVSVPQKVFTTTKDQTSAPPMLTPDNYQQPQTIPQPEVVKQNFTAKDSIIPLAGVGTNRLSYIAADNTIALNNSAFQPQTNRTLSRQALTKASLVMPVRGEIKLAIPLDTQQNLNHIMAQQALQPTAFSRTDSPQSMAVSSSQPSPQHGITNQTTNTPHMNQSPDPQQLNQPTDNQPQGEYEATFGTPDRQYFPVNQQPTQPTAGPADQSTSGPADQPNLQPPTSSTSSSSSSSSNSSPTPTPLTLSDIATTTPSVSYNQSASEAPLNPTNKVDQTDANSIESALSDLQQQANQIDPNSQPISQTDTTGKFDKFSASHTQTLPTVDPNMANLPINHPVTNASDQSSYTPLPVHPVLNPTAQTPADQPTPNLQPPTPENTPPQSPVPPGQASPSEAGGSSLQSPPPTGEPTPQYQPQVDNNATQIVQAAPTLASKQLVLTQEPNIINGRVIDSQGQSVPGVVIVVKNDLGEAKRALKTNKLGQFLVTTPLTNGTYTVEVDKKGLNFDIIQVQLTGMVLPAIEIHAK